MKNHIYLIVGILLLIFNVLFIGVLKFNDAGVTELFIKYRPTLAFNFLSNEHDTFYKDFIINHNIQGKTKSLIPLFLIQLMLSCFSITSIKTDVKRKFILFIIQFVLCICVLVPVISNILDASNSVVSVLLTVLLVVTNFFLPRIIMK
jgi:hypothetical protein